MYKYKYFDVSLLFQASLLKRLISEKHANILIWFISSVFILIGRRPLRVVDLAQCYIRQCIDHCRDIILFYTISPATFRISCSRICRIGWQLLRSGRDLCSHAENRRANVATFDKSDGGDLFMIMIAASSIPAAKWIT